MGIIQLTKKRTAASARGLPPAGCGQEQPLLEPFLLDTEGRLLTQGNVGGEAMAILVSLSVVTFPSLTGRPCPYGSLS